MNKQENNESETNKIRLNDHDDHDESHRKNKWMNDEFLDQVNHLNKFSSEYFLFFNNKLSYKSILYSREK